MSNKIETASAEWAAVQLDHQRPHEYAELIGEETELHALTFDTGASVTIAIEGTMEELHAFSVRSFFLTRPSNVETVVEDIVRAAYGTEAADTAEATIEKVLAARDDSTAHDIIDLLIQVAKEARR